MLMVGVIAGSASDGSHHGITLSSLRNWGYHATIRQSGTPLKAALIGVLSQSIFLWSMNWTLFFIGAIVAIVAILVDLQLKKRQTVWRLPALGVAVGIYMPLKVTEFLLSLVELFPFLQTKPCNERALSLKIKIADNKRRGTLIAAGLIAEESLIGVVLAIPFALYQ